ncbi:MAG: lysylphosphatidylglycerol synthase domain-containing protein, partial [Planctomycetota bacterium]
LTRNKTLFSIFATLYFCITIITILMFLSRTFQNIIPNLIKKIPILKNYHDSVFIPFLENIRRPLLFLPPILISVVTHIFLISAFWSATLFWEGYNEHKFHNFFSIVPIGFLITAIPVSVSGWGTGEAGFGFIYNVFGYPFEVGVGVSILYKFTLLILSIPGFIFWGYKFFKR